MGVAPLHCMRYAICEVLTLSGLVCVLCIPLSVVQCGCCEVHALVITVLSTAASVCCLGLWFSSAYSLCTCVHGLPLVCVDAATTSTCLGLELLCSGQPEAGIKDTCGISFSGLLVFHCVLLVAGMSAYTCPHWKAFCPVSAPSSNASVY